MFISEFRGFGLSDILLGGAREKHARNVHLVRGVPSGPQADDTPEGILDLTIPIVFVYHTK